jgi:tetratricopeptide (TPR) repeat protein
MLAELELVANLAVQPADFFGHLVHKSLLVNASSWVSLTLASDFFRVKGDYLNSIKCFQRAIAFVPRHFADIPLLSLSNMLHKLHFINDSLSVALSAALSVGGRQRDYAFLANYLGNIYVTLGELGEAHKWYDKAAKIDPSFKNSLLKKHATSCHIKLESYLEEQHSRLQKKLDELKDYQTDSDEWFQLSSKIELEKSSRDRKDFTRKVYNDFMSKSHASICDWSKLTTFTLKCARFPVHYSRFPLNSQNLTLEAFQQFYDTLWYLNGTKLDATRDTEGFCVNSTECRQDSLLNLKKGHKNQQEKSLIYSKSGESTASSQSQTDFLNSAAENDLIARLLSERDIKNRFESPSSL